jgi:hypothetical protein
MRDTVKGQSLNTKSPFDYIYMSVKEGYETDWKDKVLTRIKRSDGVLVVVSKNSACSTGETWEIQCAQERTQPSSWSLSTRMIPGGLPR